MAKDEYNPCKLIAWIYEHPWTNVSFSQPFNNLSIVVTVDYCGLDISESISMESFCNEDDLIDILNDLYHKILTEKTLKGSCIVQNGTNRINWTLYDMKVI